MGIIQLFTRDYDGSIEALRSTLEPLLWEARGKKGVRIFLLGTIPVTDPRLHKLAPPCEQAYQLATSVYTEDGMELEEFRAEVWRRAKEISRLNPFGETAKPASLKKRLGDALYKRVHDTIQAWQHPFLVQLTEDDVRVAIQWVRDADSTAELVAVEKRGGDVRSVDAVLWERGKKDGKAVGGLISYFDEEDRQKEALGSVSAREILKSYLDAVAAYRNEKTTLPQKYRALFEKGDAEGIDKLTREPLAKFPKFQRAILDERSKALGDRLLAWAKTPGTYLVVLDISHIVGKTGVAAQLRENGFDVRRVNAGEKLAK